MREETQKKIDKFLKKWRASRLAYYNDKTTAVNDFEKVSIEIQRQKELEKALVDELESIDGPIDDYLLTISSLVRNIDRRNREVMQNSLPFRDKIEDIPTLVEIMTAVCKHLDIRVFETLDDRNRLQYQIVKRGEEFKLGLSETADREKDLIFDEEDK
jgi:hypothetical protein